MIKNSPKKAVRLALLFCLIILELTSLTGCWSIKEANDLAILNVLGIDKNESGQFELTALIVKPQGQNNGDGRENQELILTGKGRSLLEAISQLSTSISKRLYFGHLQVAIIGEKAAKEGMRESLDFLNRQYDFRPNIKLLVAQGKAGDIVHTPPQLKTPLGSEIQSSIRTKKLSLSNKILNLSQFTEAFTTVRKDSYTGAINFAQENGIQVDQAASGTLQSNGKSPQESFKNEEKKNQKLNAFSIQGTAVFKGEHLAGYLTKQETRGLLWINGKLNNDVMTLKCPGNDHGTISLQTNETTSQLSPHIINGKPEMDVSIKVKGDIGQINCSHMDLSSGELEALNQELEGIVRSDINQTFAKAKENWQTDIFNFGESIYRKYPQQWKMISPAWRNGGLKEMPVHLKITANIERYGLRGR